MSMNSSDMKNTKRGEITVIERRTSKEIRQYLQQQSWYKQFVCNLHGRGKRSRNNLLRGYKSYATIGMAFLWEETPEGHDVWSHRDELFRDWYHRGVPLSLRVQSKRREILCDQ